MVIARQAIEDGYEDIYDDIVRDIMDDQWVIRYNRDLDGLSYFCSQYLPGLSIVNLGKLIRAIQRYYNEKVREQRTIRDSMQ